LDLSRSSISFEYFLIWLSGHGPRPASHGANVRDLIDPRVLQGKRTKQRALGAVGGLISQVRLYGWPKLARTPQHPDHTAHDLGPASDH